MSGFRFFKSAFFLGILIASLNPSAGRADSLATCKGTDGVGEPLVLLLTEGSPIPQEHSPQSKYYVQITTYAPPGWVSHPAGSETSQLTSNPLEKADVSPPVYWNGKTFEHSIFKLTVDGAHSLLEISDEGPLGSSLFVHVELDCE